MFKNMIFPILKACGPDNKINENIVHIRVIVETEIFDPVAKV